MIYTDDYIKEKIDENLIALSNTIEHIGMMSSENNYYKLQSQIEYLHTIYGDLDTILDVAKGRIVDLKNERL